MIRKIVVFIFFSYVLIWFAAAHCIKSRVTSYFDSNDFGNFKTSYSDIFISGFPGKITLQIDSFNLQGSQGRNFIELDIPNLSIVPDFWFKNLNILANKEILLSKTYEGYIEKYVIAATEDIKGKIILGRSILTGVNGLIGNFKGFNFQNDSLIISSDKLLVGAVSDVKFDVEFDQQDIFLKMQLDYSTSGQEYAFSDADLKIDAIAHMRDDAVKLVDLTGLSIILDKDSTLELKGVLTISEDIMQWPMGKVSVSLDNYENFIDKILPQGYDKFSFDFKSALARAAMENNSDENLTAAAASIDGNIKFDILISSDDIRIGSLTLKDFYEEEKD